MVTRADVIQSMLDLYPDPSYLEIGVDAGATFRALRAARKVAVDPAFKFRPPATAADDTVSYHEMTSDAFFASVGPEAPKFDVIYIDGLHTFEQVLRDLLNATDRLSAKGVVILDDILPNSYHASLPSLDEAFQVRNYVADRQGQPGMKADSTWMGDVYKAAFFIRGFMQAFSMATVAENHGQLVLWRAPRPAADLGDELLSSVAATDFRSTVLRRDAFNVQPLARIVDAIRTREWIEPAAERKRSRRPRAKGEASRIDPQAGSTAPEPDPSRARDAGPAARPEPVDGSASGSDQADDVEPA